MDLGVLGEESDGPSVAWAFLSGHPASLEYARSVPVRGGSDVFGGGLRVIVSVGGGSLGLKFNYVARRVGSLEVSLGELGAGIGAVWGLRGLDPIPFFFFPFLSFFFFHSTFLFRLLGAQEF